MTHSNSKIVRIVEPKGQSTLSKTQKSFNKLIKKIDAQRKLLATWQTTAPLFQPLADIHHIQHDITDLENDLTSFQNIKNLKAWIKTYRLSRQPFFDDDLFGEMGLDAFFKSR